MSIKGELADTPLVEVLQFIHLAAKSGTLRALSGDRTATIAFFRGRVIGAMRPQTRRLGEMLVAAGVVDEAAIDRALETQRGEQKRRSLGKILVVSGVTTTEVIREAVEAQIRATIFEVVGWKTGTYKFVAHDIAPVDNIAFAPGQVMPRVDINTEAILMDAMRALDERMRTRPGEACKADPPAVQETPRVTQGGATPAASARAISIPDAARDIGFYDCVECGERWFHVQTEVIGRTEAIVRSTVLEGGTVRYAERQPYPVDLEDISRVRELIQKRHENVVEKVRRDGIESR